MRNCKSFYLLICFIQLSEAWLLSVSLIMDKIKYRAVIKFFVKEGLTPNEIHSKFIKVYWDSSPSFSTIKKWAADFKCGRTSLESDPREGRSKSATTSHWTSARYGIGWTANKSAWNCWDYRHFKRTCRIYFARRIGYEKALHNAIGISGNLLMGSLYIRWVFDWFLGVILSLLILTLRWLISYIYGAPILDVSRSHTTMQHSR